MTRKTRRIAASLVITVMFVCTWAWGVELPMSHAESLVLKLATADLSSEKHPLPGDALCSFAEAIELPILKTKERTSWTLTTVRKSERFEFIHAETDGLAIRQLPEVIMFGFTPKSSKWRENLAESVLEFLRTNVEGNWDKVKADPPKTIENTTFVESAGGGFSHEVGTVRDSFVAVVVADKLWVCLPKRLHYGFSQAPWGFTPRDSSRWF
jgi:hypothetical protein